MLIRPGRGPVLGRRDSLRARIALDDSVPDSSTPGCKGISSLYSTGLMFMVMGHPLFAWTLIFMSVCVNGVHGMLSGTASMDFGGKKNAGVAVGIIDARDEAEVMRCLLVFLLFLGFCWPQLGRADDTRVAPKDDWTGPDKALHFSASMAIGSASFVLFDLLRDDDDGWEHAAAAMGMVLGVGLAKELGDSLWGSGFSEKDLLWDLAGGLLSVGLSWLVWELCHSR